MARLNLYMYLTLVLLYFSYTMASSSSSTTNDTKTMDSSGWRPIPRRFQSRRLNTGAFQNTSTMDAETRRSYLLVYPPRHKNAGAKPTESKPELRSYPTQTRYHRMMNLDGAQSRGSSGHPRAPGVYTRPGFPPVVNGPPLPGHALAQKIVSPDSTSQHQVQIQLLDGYIVGPDARGGLQSTHSAAGGDIPTFPLNLNQVPEIRLLLPGDVHQQLNNLHLPTGQRQPKTFHSGQQHNNRQPQQHYSINNNVRPSYDSQRQPLPVQGNREAYKNLGEIDNSQRRPQEVYSQKEPVNRPKEVMTFPGQNQPKPYMKEATNSGQNQQNYQQPSVKQPVTEVRQNYNGNVDPKIDPRAPPKVQMNFASNDQSGVRGQTQDTLTYSHQQNAQVSHYQTSNLNQAQRGYRVESFKPLQNQNFNQGGPQNYNSQAGNFNNKAQDNYNQVNNQNNNNNGWKVAQQGNENYNRVVMPEDRLVHNAEQPVGQNQFQNANQADQNQFQNANQHGQNQFQNANQPGQNQFPNTNQPGQNQFQNANQPAQNQFQNANQHGQNQFQNANQFRPSNQDMDFNRGNFDQNSVTDGDRFKPTESPSQGMTTLTRDSFGDQQDSNRDHPQQQKEEDPIYFPPQVTEDQVVFDMSTLSDTAESSGQSGFLENKDLGQTGVMSSKPETVSASGKCDCNRNCAPVTGKADSGATIREIARSLNAEAFFQFVGMTDDEIEALLAANGPYTLFIPSNEAVSRLPSNLLSHWKENSPDFTMALLNHVVQDAISLDQLKQGGRMESKARGATLFINNYNNEAVTVNGHRIVTGDVRGPSGGTIHVVDGTLCPVADRDVIETLRACSKYDGFLTLADVTRLLDTMQGDGPYTLFLPTNDALTKIPSEELAIIKENTTLLREFLQYHIVEGAYFSGDLKDGQYLTTLHQKVPIRVGIRVDGCYRRLVEVNNSPVIKSDIPAKNGVIHVIDWVLRPNDLSWCEGVVLP